MKVDDVAVGGSTGAIVMMLPNVGDTLTDLLTKVVIGVVVAMITGTCHSAVKGLWDKLSNGSK